MRYCVALLLSLCCFISPANAANELTLPSANNGGQPYSIDNDLIYRINFGSEDDIRVLLDKGANPNARSEQGNTAFAVAMQRSDEVGFSMAKILIEKGANPNLEDNNKNYPLALAIHAGRVDIVQTLMDKGADYHAKDSNGVSMLQMAKQDGNQQIIHLIGDPIAKETAYAESMRSPQRFNEIIRRYSFYSCSYQYWSYFLASRQDPDKDADTQKKITDSKTALAELLEQIQKYYPTATTDDLQKVADDSASSVSKPLDDMISNRNRAINGIGKEEDANTRCRAIADSTKPAFIPSDLRK